MENEQQLNEKILQVTMTIKQHYPELLTYLNEMPVTIPNESRPEISLLNLKTYADSLTALLSKYILEHRIM